MTSFSILACLQAFRRTAQRSPRESARADQFEGWPNRHALVQPAAEWPAFVRDCQIARYYHTLLGPLAWADFPERDRHASPSNPAVPYAPFLAASLVKLDQHLVSMGQLRDYLVAHPALVWLLGFPLVVAPQTPLGFDPDASLPTARHFTRLLRTIPDALPQFLLDSSVRVIRTELQPHGMSLGEVVAFDTKHILAWVKENNPKAYLAERFNKAKQPAGDPDCKLGCKRRHNQSAQVDALPTTPRHNPQPPRGRTVGEFYWGYASGVVVVHLPGAVEVVLAELTQPFDRPDVAYFVPLMQATEQRLGHPPRFGTGDAAFDAFYVYEYFHAAGGFAAIPFAERGGHRRQFSPDGLPLCQAGLAMPLRYTFQARNAVGQHAMGRYACPLLFPEPTGQRCPIRHRQWPKGGCLTTMALSPGARLRYQLDRESEAFQQVYRQRTATERINSQAVALGIERPHLRNGAAIAHQNTLIYTLLNLRALQRLRRLTPADLGQAPA